MCRQTLSSMAKPGRHWPSVRVSSKVAARTAITAVAECALAFLAILAMTVATCGTVRSQELSREFNSSLHWRNIGPFRGGRTRAATGVPSQPNVFYVAAVDGGVWKTTDYGRTWTPIFDDQPTGSVGSIAVSESDPNIIYVGSGEGLHRPDLSIGDGFYKSTDAGKTWAHLGLREGQQIPRIIIDPRDSNRIYVAVAGHPYGPNPERGIFRSVDGGKTFEKVLFKDENTGGADVVLDRSHPDTVYASLWEAREGPWENGSWNGTGAGIFKSTDGGTTWRQLAKGLPEGIVQANLAIARSRTSRLFASVATLNGVGLYRSDDSGETWVQATTDPRPAARIGGGDLPVPKIDPKDPDVIYSASVVTWKSTDGGRTWTGIRGAPGGDDYQNVWINPNNTDIILLGSDQGAIITVNGGRTWSSWYNQPTAQLYHVGTDNAFPYRVCSGQQESGSVCIASRSDDGEITFRDWHPVMAEEYGYVTPDPLNPEIVFGGKLTRYDRRLSQAQNILPKPLRPADFRVVRTEPVVFSPVDPHVLYFAANTLWKTMDGGNNWQQISPDLTRKTFAVPATVGKYRSLPTAQPVQRGVIYAVAPSPLDVNRIWAGTDDGLIHVTTDGGANWSDVTPEGLAAWQKISIIDAGHFDAQSAYAAVNTLRLDDLRPHIFRTHDSGRHWTEITNGIPQNENVNVVREDTRRKGLLFAGTERAVYVSFDDGDRWQPLRLNMPATSVRDLVIKDDDLVVATHGRGFWIMDDITPLRQVDRHVLSSHGFLFLPQTALRVRWNTNPDTPLPPDVPVGENPPDGAVIDYYVGRGQAGPVTIEIRDSNGQLVRRYSSNDPVPPPDPMLPIPAYWVRPPQVISAAPGMHRFTWDMRYPPVPGVKPDYPISAVYRNTPPAATSPWVMPGQYTVVLTVNRETFKRPLDVRMDPRVKTTVAALARQFELSKSLYDLWVSLQAINGRAASLSTSLTDLKVKGRTPNTALAAQIQALLEKVADLGGPAGPRRGAAPALAVLARVQTLFGIIQDADVEPSAQAAAAVDEIGRESRAVIERWRALESQDIPALNRQLSGAGLSPVEIKEQ